mmetsp:Transcript_11690/g.23462  ORF Transcript_11690/g.23462 Transcript_11690/m.23462 type:complete len:430 (+) Transcript_11690:65-1354(+)
MIGRDRPLARQAIPSLCIALLLLCTFTTTHSFVSTTAACNKKLRSHQPTTLSVHCVQNNNSTHVLTRRSSIITSSIAIASSCFFPQLPSSAADIDVVTTTEQQSTAARASITIPLKYEPKLCAYTVSYVVGETKFGAIVDTGSPFLVVPQTSCRPDYKWGCYRAEESQPSGLEPTYERFVGNEGMMEWREGKFSFPNSIAMVSSFALLFPQSSSMVFGVVSESLLDGSGGLFLGLVKETNSWIRPSFLGQSDVGAFSVDLREREGFDKSLTLYGGSRQPQQKFSNPSYAIPLVRDLNKRFGDATIHYVGVASSLIVNGNNLATSSRRNKIYVIFDTGCTGMSISTSLFNERYSIARERRENNLWGNVELQFNTVSGGMASLNAKKPLTTTLDDRPWGKKLDGHLIVLGLAFLEGHEMTVDIDNDKIWFD